MSLGILGRKIGMMQWFDEEGRAVAATVISVEPSVIVQIKRSKREGYNALQLGYGEIREKLVSQPLLGHFAKAGVSPLRQLREMRLAELGDYQVGQQLGAEIFQVGERISASALSKGRGFAGVMKRHGFHGGPASHGSGGWRRRPGSIGNLCATGRVFKGKKMAGRLGGKRVTTQGLKVLAADPERKLLVLAGATPGRRNALVELSKSG